MAYAEDSGDITLAFTGDVLPTRRVSVHAEPEFLAVAELLRRADASIANSETLYHQFEGYPAVDSGPDGGHVTSHPDIIDDLRWLGFDMVSTANNHCADYGEAGLLASLDNLGSRGLPHAGAGRSLTEAVQPCYLPTAGGTVAMVAVTLTLPPGDHRAGEPRGAVKARPGANVLRHSVRHEVPEAAFRALLDLGASLEMGRQFRHGGDTVTFLGRTFTLGEQYRTMHDLDPFDLELNLRSIAEARRRADWVVVSVHCHESGATREDPPGFAVDFAHQALDAGGDILFGHGPQLDRGIEIYHGKPAFHALGSFIRHDELIPQWDPISLQSVVATVRFRGGRLAEIELHPVDLGLGTPERRRAGRPLLADGEIATRIIRRFARMSAKYGTRVELVSRPGPVGLITAAG